MAMLSPVYHIWGLGKENVPKRRVSAVGRAGAIMGFLREICTSVTIVQNLPELTGDPVLQEKVKKLSVDRNTDKAPEKGYIYDGTAEPGTKYDESVAHSWLRDWNDVDATCTTNGKESYTCVVCGKKRTDTIQAAGHRKRTAPSCDPCGTGIWVLHCADYCIGYGRAFVYRFWICKKRQLYAVQALRGSSHVSGRVPHPALLSESRCRAFL